MMTENLEMMIKDFGTTTENLETMTERKKNIVKRMTGVKEDIIKIEGAYKVAVKFCFHLRNNIKLF